MLCKDGTFQISFNQSRPAEVRLLDVRLTEVRLAEVRDYAELARLGYVTRARLTQIMNLLLLATDIQEAILFKPRRRPDQLRNHGKRTSQRFPNHRLDGAAAEAVRNRFDVQPELRAHQSWLKNRKAANRCQSL